MSTPSLIVTDMHRRITGVGSTVRTLVPFIAEQESLALISSHPHHGQTPKGLWETFRLCRTPTEGKPFRIWHVRRNNEMIWGLVFKHLLRCPIKLVLTSAAIRRHSWFPRQLINQMDAVIATSDAAAQHVPNVVRVVPHGVNCDRFQPIADRNQALREFEIPGEQAVGIIGRVRPEKGTDLFVNAMLRLLPRYLGITACLAGRATVEHEAFQRRLKRQIEEAGLTNRFCWLGEVDYSRMPRLLGALSLCVAPARYEGFGLVPLEAMACGTPVVASRTGAYPSMIEPGINGDLVECDDLDGLIASLDSMLSDRHKLEEMRTVARTTAEDKFSARCEAERIVEVFREMWEEKLRVES